QIVVGSPIANRNYGEIEGLIGFFVNMLVLRADLGGNPSFRALLKQVREVTLGAYSHHNLPFEKLVEELQPERALNHNPMFQVIFGMHNTPHRVGALLAGHAEARSGALGQLDYEVNTTRFDLEVHLWDQPQGLSGMMVYNSDLFEETTIRRMVGHYETLLGSTVADPGQPISTLSLLGPAERKQVLEDWNRTRVEYPRGATLVSLFEQQVELAPEATALSCEALSLSYRELN